MLRYISPRSVYRSPEGRLASVLLAAGLTVAACTGNQGTSSAASETSAAHSTGAASASSVGQSAGSSGATGSASSSARAGGSITVNNNLCTPGQTKKAPDGSTLYCEQMQYPSAGVFHDYRHAALPYARTIKQGETILVACVQAGPIGAATTAHGNPGDPNAEWYKIAEPEDLRDGYTAANDFWNVTDHRVPFDQQPAVDPAVPACALPNT